MGRKHKELIQGEKTQPYGATRRMALIRTREKFKAISCEALGEQHGYEFMNVTCLNLDLNSIYPLSPSLLTCFSSAE